MELFVTTYLRNSDERKLRSYETDLDGKKLHSLGSAHYEHVKK